MNDGLSHPPEALVICLAQAARKDLELAGGKAANLGELARQRFPVPAAFVVTTAAYDRFVTQHGLGQVIRQALETAAGKGADIRAAFESVPIPAEIEKAVLAAYEQLQQGPVAVRSSATAEDLPEAAFAGQQDTYLNVIGQPALLEAVRRCWASLWTERAIAYRARQGVDQQSVKLAVLVQRMVPAEFAGVMFTANPVTGERDEVIVDANPGQGEAVVLGQATPDHYVLRRQRWGWRLLERQAGRREVVIRPRAGGGTEHDTNPALSNTGALPGRALWQLARLGTAIQQHFGSPQDIEWAWAENRPFILQARPITALPDPPPRATRLERLLASNFGEMMPVRPYPLDLDTWIPSLGGAVEPMLDLLGLRWRLVRLFETDDAVVVRIAGELPRPTWRVLLAPARLLARVRRYDPLAWQADPLLATARARTRELDALDPRTLDWEQLLALLTSAKGIPHLMGELRNRYLPPAAFAAVRLRLLLIVLGQANRFGALLSGAENKTVEANRALEALAHRVRSDPDLAVSFGQHSPEGLWAALAAQPAYAGFLSQLRAFLEVYGHREMVLSTALQATWRDAPEAVLAIVKSLAAHPPRPASQSAAWQAARDQVLQHRLLHARPLRSTFLKILEKARTLLQIREDTHFYATLPLPLFRRVLLEAGRRLVEARILDAAEDVFHLRLAELEQAGSQVPPPEHVRAALRAAAQRRQQARAALEGRPMVDPRIYFRGARPPGVVLHGVAGSPGVAEGPARIVRSSLEFGKLRPGEVLVAPFTNPSWTPLFQRAVAIVVDSGSIASHAAIVAREYGIPAVMSTVTGTQTLQDGEVIRVDGSLGAVWRATERRGQAPHG
jgi:rifampicin phosphotransferase